MWDAQRSMHDHVVEMAAIIHASRMSHRPAHMEHRDDGSWKVVPATWNIAVADPEVARDAMTALLRSMSHRSNRHYGVDIHDDGIRVMESMDTCLRHRGDLRVDIHGKRSFLGTTVDDVVGMWGPLMQEMSSDGIFHRRVYEVLLRPGVWTTGIANRGETIADAYARSGNLTQIMCECPEGMCPGEYENLRRCVSITSI
jgi:hypothetical protein